MLGIIGENRAESSWGHLYGLLYEDDAFGVWHTSALGLSSEDRNSTER